jgi:hypothetical protein
MLDLAGYPYPAQKPAAGEILLKFVMAETLIARLILSLPQRFSGALRVPLISDASFDSHCGQNFCEANGVPVPADA